MSSKTFFDIPATINPFARAKPYSYPDMGERNNGDPRMTPNVIIDGVNGSEFNGRTTNLNQGASGEKYIIK